MWLLLLSWWLLWLVDAGVAVDVVVVGVAVANGTVVACVAVTVVVDVVVAVVGPAVGTVVLDVLVVAANIIGGRCAAVAVIDIDVAFAAVADAVAVDDNAAVVFVVVVAL